MDSITHRWETYEMYENQMYIKYISHIVNLTHMDSYLFRLFERPNLIRLHTWATYKNQKHVRVSTKKNMHFL